VKRSTKEEFLTFLEPVYPRLSRYSLAITRNQEEAEDLTSDTVLIALEQFEKMKDKEHFAGFLFKVASRLYKRKHYRERFRTNYNRETAETQEDSAPKPDQAAEIAIVMSALGKLPPKMKETVVLFDVADLSLEEIQSIQGGTLSGVKSRLRRGRETIKKNLGINERGEGINFRGMKHENLSPALVKQGEYYAL
jgi:RNA polymerase sigma-70 factor (ECF subfamily)